MNEEIEEHPFEAFLPKQAKVLFLGTFPAKPIRWSMNFYYPNFTNDFWRIMGLLFFGKASHFEIRQASGGKNRWNEPAIRAFAQEKGLAFSDTAKQIRRLKGNASDADLEIIQPRDIDALLSRLPHCEVIAATGGKASEVIAHLYGTSIPSPGGHLPLRAGNGRQLPFWRLPSTSRAYPLPLAQKATPYRALLQSVHLL